MYSLIFLFIVLIGTIDYRIPLGSFWDEAVVLIVIALWIFKLICDDDRIPRHFFVCVLAVILMLAIGIAGNLLHPGYQESIVAIVKDIFAFIKFPIVMLLAPELIKPTEKDRKKIEKIAKILVVVTIVFAVVGYVVDIGVYANDVTRVLKTFEFFYQHCTFFVFSYVIVLVALINKSMKKNCVYILMCCFLLFMTQRTKAYFVIALVLFIMVVGSDVVTKFFKLIPNKVKIKSKYFVCAAVLLLIAGWMLGKDKILYHFQYGLSAARPALYIVGIFLARDYFPIGSGFGTFASFLSGEYYSNVYYEYGISTVMGMRPESYSFIGDVFWPYIYGQLGVLGLILFVMIVVCFFVKHLRKVANKNQLVVFLIIWIYALFASTAEAFFTNGSAIQMALALALFVGNKEGKIDRRII